MRLRSVTPRISIGANNSDFVSFMLAMLARFADDCTTMRS
jgi:hypothetical protein